MKLARATAAARGQVLRKHVWSVAMTPGVKSSQQGEVDQVWLEPGGSQRDQKENCDVRGGGEAKIRQVIRNQDGHRPEKQRGSLDSEEVLCPIGKL